MKTFAMCVIARSEATKQSFLRLLRSCLPAGRSLAMTGVSNAKLLVILAFAFIITSSSLILNTPAFAANKDFSLYYVSPFGGFNSLRLLPRTQVLDVGNGSPCNDNGLMYIHDDGLSPNLILYFCKSNIWTPYGGAGSEYWTQDTNISHFPPNYYIFPSTNTTSTSIGIGTATPYFRWQMENNAGIVS